MPPTDNDEGIRVAADLRDARPEVGVVVVSSYAEPEDVLKLLDDGSSRRAYLLKDRVHHRGQLVDAVRAVHVGSSYVDAKIVGVLLRIRAQGPRLAAVQPSAARYVRRAAAARGAGRG